VAERRTEAEGDPRILGEISALADGTLEQERAAELRELIATSSELGALYERERQAVLALQSLSADRAPASLRFAIETRRHQAELRRRRLFSGWALTRGRPLYGGALAATVAAAVALLVLLLPGGSPGAPSVSQAASLALRGATLPAPVPSGTTLRADVEEVYFPNWSGRFHWRAVGQRIDHLRGRLAVTVYYQWDRRRIAYTILAAPPLRQVSSRMLHLDGIELQSFGLHGRLVVTWRRAGHTCVLSGAGMTTAELAKLAGWKAPGLKA
jgi:hypothetical protein